MLRNTATFYGSKLDAYGMPDPFHRYDIFSDATPNIGGGRSVAIVVSITGSPTPNPNRFIGPTDQDAVDTAIADLRAMSQLKSLNERIS